MRNKQSKPNGETKQQRDKIFYTKKWEPVITSFLKGVNKTQLCKEYRISRSTLYRRRKFMVNRLLGEM